MAALAPSIEKEFRAVAPVWLAAVGAAIVAATGADSRLAVLAVGALTLGSIATGAQAMGYEYSHRTLGMALAQPMPRMRHLVIKVGVLAVFLAALAGVATVAMNVHAEHLAGSIWNTSWVLVLALLYGLLVAPWMTIVSRSVLGGVVFGISLPAIIALAGVVYGGRVYGLYAAGEVDQMRLLFLWRGSLALAAVSAVALVWQFTHLEAIEGHRALSLPRWLPARAAVTAGTRRRHPVWMLVKKELRLQQMTFVVAGLYVATATVAVVFRAENAVSTFEWLLPVTAIYLAILAVLVGALASAEERQAGTIEWQQLLPVPWRMQWGVKVGTVLALVLLLAVAMPMALMWIAGSILGLVPPVVGRITGTHVVMVLWIASLSLYLSSISSSGIRAMVLMAPVGAALIFVAPSAFEFARWLAGALAVPMAGALGLRSWRVPGSSMPFLAMACAVALASVVLLSFAARNHRTADAPPILAQAAAIAGAAVTGIVLANIVLVVLYGSWVVGR
jgi:ABC-type transport system involved in multi-copper enzyme maturation permease subunit